MTNLAKKLCSCIKNVRRTVKVNKNNKSNKEQAAIGICVKSVLHSRGLTVRKFRCGNAPVLKTQPKKNSLL